MSNRVASWRQQLGASTELWAGAGRHEVNDQRWLTLSGSPSIDYNVVLCYGDGPGDWGSLLSESLADVKAATVPSVVMVTGAALGSVQVLIDAKWVCIGEVPLMHLPATPVSPDPNDAAIRKLGAEDLAASRDVVSRAFGSPPNVADLGIPDATVEPGPFSLWGVEIDGRLVSVAAAVRVGSSAAFWSVATPPDEQGRRLRATALCLAASPPQGGGSRGLPALRIRARPGAVPAPGVPRRGALAAVVLSEVGVRAGLSTADTRGAFEHISCSIGHPWVAGVLPARHVLGLVHGLVRLLPEPVEVTVLAAGGMTHADRGPDTQDLDA